MVDPDGEKHADAVSFIVPGAEQPITIVEPVAGQMVSGRSALTVRAELKPTAFVSDESLMRLGDDAAWSQVDDVVIVVDGDNTTAFSAPVRGPKVTRTNLEPSAPPTTQFHARGITHLASSFQCRCHFPSPRGGTSSG